MFIDDQVLRLFGSTFERGSFETARRDHEFLLALLALPQSTPMLLEMSCKSEKKSKKGKSNIPDEVKFGIEMKMTHEDKSSVLYKFDADRFNHQDSLKLQVKKFYAIKMEIDPTPVVPLR